MPLRYRVWKRILNGTPRARYYGPDKTPRVEWNEYRSRESYGDTGRGSTALQGGTHSENGRAQDERSASGTISAAPALTTRKKRESVSGRMKRVLKQCRLGQRILGPWQAATLCG